jgi:hypothetical protein
METRIIHTASVFAMMLLLVGCSGMGLGSLDTSEGSHFPGTDHLDTETPEEKKNREWWESFYGKKSGAESDCDFYGNCKSQQKSGGWW